MGIKVRLAAATDHFVEGDAGLETIREDQGNTMMMNRGQKWGL